MFFEVDIIFLQVWFMTYTHFYRSNINLLQILSNFYLTIWYGSKFSFHNLRQYKNCCVMVCANDITRFVSF